ncbi:hypothetical protein NQ315_016302 [Exocentrus adspersus]|uniref:C2H2-type domain-containing protein n=1 Tax=Exocentrus adspersus TaxID=1586481 RepID=A0AAV8VPM3_9CUCU|nr:hypothetical protein NQ315_016302 [Exocentrus adspersus]
MSVNTYTAPLVLQLKDAVNAIHLTEEDMNNIGLTLSDTGIAFVPAYEETVEQICIESAPGTTEEVIHTGAEVVSDGADEMANVVYNYEIVYPEQLNLTPLCGLKRGRPRKKKLEQAPAEEPVKTVPRTRSGRAVRFPKYIEKAFITLDFKKVETDDGSLNSKDEELKTSEFIRFEEDPEEVKKSTEIPLMPPKQRRRKISSQYRCPKCQKVYLGKNKMIQHIKKYPDHGPAPHNELNFDVWNYLVDITQKCSPAQRGIKFCEELTNLLHNVLLLTSALFKKPEPNKNLVDVDKVLGNAIGLPPGSYRFNENELYKDVTVLKLITNSDFFKPVEANEDAQKKVKLTEDGTAVSVDVKVTRDKTGIDREKNIFTDKNTSQLEEKVNLYFRAQEISTFSIAGAEKNKKEHAQCTDAGNFINNFERSTQPRLLVHTDLLSDSSLLNLPNLRNSVDELILSSVDSNTNLLDNSTSSDELMNVDQFVNERFKKITEPEMEINASSLNLDLPSLDLFQFHTS